MDQSHDENAPDFWQRRRPIGYQPPPDESAPEESSKPVPEMSAEEYAAARSQLVKSEPWGESHPAISQRPSNYQMHAARRHILDRPGEIHDEFDRD